MEKALEEEELSAKLLHQQLSAEIVRLDHQEENLLDLVADGHETSAKVKQRLNAIQLKRSKLTEELGQTGERLAVGAALIENALVLLADPQGMYEKMADDQRRLMNQAVFEKLYVIEDSVTEAVFNPPFDELLQARSDLSKVPGKFGRPRRPSESLATALSGVGSNKRVMVEVMRLCSNPSWPADQGLCGGDSDLYRKSSVRRLGAQSHSEVLTDYVRTPSSSGRNGLHVDPISSSEIPGDELIGSAPIATSTRFDVVILPSCRIARRRVIGVMSCRPVILGCYLTPWRRLATAISPDCSWLQLPPDLQRRRGERPHQYAGSLRAKISLTAA
jgi:hypothetical protein